MSANNNPLRKNGCLRLKNPAFQSFLFQYNGVSFFATMFCGVFIPLNPAGTIIVDDIARRMKRTSLDFIPKDLFEHVKDLYETITDLNEFETPEYVNYHVFYELKKQRILELPRKKQSIVQIEKKEKVLSRGQSKHERIIQSAIEVQKQAAEVKVKHDFFPSNQPSNAIGDFRKE